MNYHVLVDDIFCSTDKSHRYTKGEYSTYAEALAVCREMVDRFLRHECAPGMPASALYLRYMMFGKDPFIVEHSEAPDTSPGFSAWDYAKARCEELCSRPANAHERTGFSQEMKDVRGPDRSLHDRVLDVGPIRMFVDAQPGGV
jgi:hypothetical protein